MEPWFQPINEVGSSYIGNRQTRTTTMSDLSDLRSTSLPVSHITEVAFITGDFISP